MGQGYRSKFFENYAVNVLPKLSSLERERKVSCFKLIIIEISLFSVCLLMWNIFTFKNMMSLGFLDNFIYYAIFTILGSVPFFILIEMFVIPFKMNKNFTKKLKKLVVNNLMNSFDNICYHGKYLPIPLESLIISSEIIPSYTDHFSGRCEFDDSFTICYKGIKCCAAEAVISRDTDNGGVCFSGIILSFPFNKNVRAKTIIMPKPGRGEVFLANSIMICIIIALLCAIVSIGMKEVLIALGQNIVGLIILIFFVIIMIITLCYKKFIKIKLEDIVFDKYYTTYSEDQVEARYLLTPSFMERFKNLEKAYGSKDIRCAFFDDQIMFAISTNKDLFEIGSLYHPLSDSRQVETFYNEITAIFDIIDELKLNEKTGL